MALDGALIRRVGAAIARGRLLAAGEPVLVLVSGGADSTLLAHALGELGHPLETLHVRHELRGAESAADAEACRALAARLAVPHRELDGLVVPGPGTEARARLLRRAAADEVRDGRAVATGHTRDDRVETILYRLAASPGSSAFAALPAADGDGRVRPLLELGREEVRDGLRRAGIGWREDSSNADRAFARNRVRLDLLPAFRSLHPAAEANLLRTAALLAEDDAALDALAAELLCEGGGLSTAAVAAAPPAVLRRALRRVAGFPAPRPVAAERLGALARARAGAGSVPLGAGRVAERRYGRIVDRPRRAARAAAARGRARGARPDGLRRRGRSLRARGRRKGARRRARATARCARAACGRAVARRAAHDRAHAAGGARAPKRARSLPCRLRARRGGGAAGHRRRARPATAFWTRAHFRRHVNGSPADPDGVLEGVLISEDELRARVVELGEQVSRDYDGLDPLLVAVLKGAVIFAGDLLRAITIPCSIDFMAISSYGSGTESSGVVRILKDLDEPIAGRHVLVVEDIIDSGLTLSYLLGSLASRGPASLEICALLAKPDRREVDVPCRYVGFEIPNRFVVGYGLDADEQFRGLPYVATVDEQRIGH